MKRKLGTIGVALAAAALLLPSAPAPTAHAQGGGADFTRFVGVGDSLTAGFQDGSLYDGGSHPPDVAGQTHGFIPLLGQAMGTQVVLPLITYPGLTSTGLLVRNPNSPCAFGATAFTTVPPSPSVTRSNQTVPATNVAIPGFGVVAANTVKWVFPPQSASELLVFAIIGLPYAGAGGTPKTQVETAVGLNPTFVSLWLGGNDALGAATAADVSLLTPAATFNTNAEQIFAALDATGATGVVANVPDVTVIPHLFSQADLVALTGGAINADGIELLTGVKKKDYVPLSQIPAVVAIIGNPSSGPLAENQILRANEVKKIQKGIKKFNKKIAALARANDWALVDIFSILNDYNRNGLMVGTVPLTTNYLGGIFGLDGVHPSNTGHALVAAAFVQAINAKYGTTLAPPNIPAILAADPNVCTDGSKAGLTLEDVAAMAPAGAAARDMFSEFTRQQ
jgi:lysophospholipase L1-like esterase